VIKRLLSAPWEPYAVSDAASDEDPYRQLRANIRLSWHQADCHNTTGLPAAQPNEKAQKWEDVKMLRHTTMLIATRIRQPPDARMR